MPFNNSSSRSPGAGHCDQPGHESHQRQSQQIGDSPEATIDLVTLVGSDLSSLSDLQNREQEAMIQEIVLLGQQISGVTKATRYFKSDLSRWREVFELYLRGRIFFTAQETGREFHSSSRARQQLAWFQNEVAKRDLIQRCEVPSSRIVFERFLDLNVTLLRNLQFQEINKLALTTILEGTCLYLPFFRSDRG